MKIDYSSSFASVSEQVITSEVDHPVDSAMALTTSSVTKTKSQAQQSLQLVFVSTFLTVFLAEFGDKTQLSTLLMSAESQSPWIVFVGAATALIATSLISVLLGRWMANRLTPKTIEILAGASMLLIAASLFWDILN